MHPVFRLLVFGLLLTFSSSGRLTAEEVDPAESYCQRCHEPHGGLDPETHPCLGCHAPVPMGQMNLIPWYTSEGALAGLNCIECHKILCQGYECLTCHPRHTDPLR